MYKCEFLPYVGPEVAIVGDSDGSGAVNRHDRHLLIPPIYDEVVLLDLKIKTLLVYEKRIAGRAVGIYSVDLREWLHRPQFTDVTIKNSRTLNVWIGKLKGECDLTTGELTWFL